MLTILVVDDDPVVVQVVRQTLRDEPYQTQVARTGEQALDSVAAQRPDLIILDVMMPDLDGFEVCRRIRANPFTSRIPILFLTANDRPQDRARGLDAGSDDFLSKSALRSQLPARIRAILRRSAANSLPPPEGAAVDTNSITIGGVRLYVFNRIAEIGDTSLTLTPLEHRLLGYLMTHSPRPVSTHSLLEHVWDYPPGAGDEKVVRVTIKRLRDRLEQHLGRPYIQNIRGQGYLIPD